MFLSCKCSYSLCLLLAVCAIISDVALCGIMHPSAVKGRQTRNPDFEANWNAKAQAAITRALGTQKLNTNVAKNVILFLGDGMGISTVTAGRIYAGQLKGEIGESYELSFDKFPHVALSKTYNVDHQVPDSAGTATAYLCGEKANLGVIGVNQKVLRGNCSTMSEENNIDSILRWSLNEGKRAGVVTTTRITHATPSAAYAHVPDRDFEVDTNIDNEEDRNNPLCEDIASQLITKNHDINVILGGGRRFFMPNTSQDYEYALPGNRSDGRNLIEEWKENMAAHGHSHEFVWNKTEFDRINVESTDYVLGLFEPDHMKYGLEREGNDEPNLAQLTSFAINSLQRSEKGYFLLVEGGKIDHGHHANWAKAALHELAEFEDAVQVAVDLTKEEDTLIVVTADHSHVFTVGGYPSRNNPILSFINTVGLESPIPYDGLPYTTLQYANGPNANVNISRTDLTGVDTTENGFLQPALVPINSESHGGEDVAIFARGPMSHLFHGVQEQNYIAHAMAYASCVGQNKQHCDNVPSASKTVFQSSYLMLFTIVMVYLYRNYID